MTPATSYVQLDTEPFQSKNEYDALIEKFQELKDANSKFDRQKRAAGSSSSQLQQQNTNLKQQNANLQQQASTLQQSVTNLQQQNQALSQPSSNPPQNAHSIHRSAEHPDPELFSADDPKQRKDLPLFIRKINMKLNTNADWYPSEQSKMVYVISRLRGKAYSTIAYGIKRDGTVQFPSTDAILTLLEQYFSDVDEINTGRREILSIKQAHKDTATHIIDWFEIAQRTDLSDNALINHLYDSLHPEITTPIRNRVMLR
ncbi:hypothetical protein K3495_g9929 [Podosphaera aphanis]|nr:hypothetical protein K3495_g9929 [Podosphaera aphanis]